ncbi:glycosyltransferase family 39 protein [Cupriavidus pinatubonensis]|uniref:glycosyltransferase family 39 protein n=1 Tax=Cupriavidus pinatubonensis TaxID=248026 RepID=UPI00112D1D4B|nr:glycosyltransferase family 39 protein [Cupriavidus pinatubonensis]TPQ31457.1 4-amino-4-deoxy-L-arabinose transferase [Cupriavidus pinatubonensis]
MFQGSDRLTKQEVLAAQAAQPWHKRRFGGVPLIVLAGVCVLIALLWFGTLGMRHLIGPDEGRYAEIAREMFVSGDWVTIRYNDLKYFEKPPFHMWVTALSYSLFGIGEWQARLCVALAGAIGLLASMLAANRWFGARAALLTGLVLVAAPMWSVAAHFNTLDMTLSGAMACVLAFMLLAQHPQASPAARRNWMLACWVAMGVAILTKGLVGIALPGLVLVIYTLVSRDFALWRRLHLVSGIALMLLVAVPWFWLVSERNPEFLRFFFIHEHWERYTSTVHSRKGPLLYFVPLVIAGFLPWLGLFPRMWQAVRERAGVERGTAARPFQPALLAAVWAIVIFVFFSLSRSKLPGYILPIFPALGIIAGAALDTISERSWRRQLLAGLAIGAIGLLASPIVATLNSNNTPNALYRAYAIWAAVAFAMIIASTLVARWLLQRRGLLASITVYAVGMCTAFTAALLGHEVIGRSASGIDMIQPLARVLRPDMKFYGVRVLDHTLPFYLRHPLVMVERPDELEFGVTQEPQKWLPTTAAFLSEWQDGKPALAIMSPQTFDELSQHAPMYVVARDWRRVAVTNFAVNPPAPQR